MNPHPFLPLSFLLSRKFPLDVFLDVPKLVSVLAFQFTILPTLCGIFAIIQQHGFELQGSTHIWGFGFSFFQLTCSVPLITVQLNHEVQLTLAVQTCLIQGLIVMNLCRQKADLNYMQIFHCAGGLHPTPALFKC